MNRLLGRRKVKTHAVFMCISLWVELHGSSKPANKRLLGRFYWMSCLNRHVRPSDRDQMEIMTWCACGSFARLHRWIFLSRQTMTITRVYHGMAMVGLSISDILPYFTRETTFVTSCWPSCTSNPSEKESIPKGKNPGIVPFEQIPSEIRKEVYSKHDENMLI